MRILLDRKGLEAPLPDMARGAVALVVTPYVGGQEPLKVAREVAFSPRPQDQMKVIRHETETHHPHRYAPGGRRQQFEKAAIVRDVVKHFRPAITPVQDVVAQTTDGRSGGARHAGSVGVPAVTGKDKSRMSPFIHSHLSIYPTKAPTAPSPTPEAATIFW